MPTASETRPPELDAPDRALLGRCAAPKPPTPVLGIEAGGGVAAPADATLGRSETLDEGEIVILRIRPSLWFLILSARGSGLLLGALGVLAYFATSFFWLHAYRGPILQCVLIAAALRLVVAFYLRATRWYVLTNRRVMWLAGGLRPLEFTALLTQIERCDREAAAGQRLFGVSTLTMPTRSKDGLVLIWDHIRRGEQIQRQIRDAIHKARNGKPPE